jgi:hypothetical protein
VKSRYKGKNVDLSLLSERVVKFFIEKEFTTSLRKEKEKYVIVATPQMFHGIAENINVEVSGGADDFTVTFDAGSHSRGFVILGNILALFGAGFFVLKGIKSLEEIEKLEKTFWAYVDETIWQLGA